MILWIALLADVAGLSATVKATTDKEVASLAELYRHLHRNPELSGAEKATSARIAEELTKAGYQVTGALAARASRRPTCRTQPAGPGASVTSSTVDRKQWSRGIARSPAERYNAPTGAKNHPAAFAITGRRT